MKLDDRIAAVVSAAKGFSWLGELTLESISGWIELELGRFLSNSQPQTYGDQHCLIVPLNPILHIVSGNTPHAALQSLIRGVLVGATNRIKLPQEGLPEVEAFVQKLPKELQPDLAITLPGAWLQEAEAIVVFGSDQTIEVFSQKILPSQRLLAHGHKLSFGLIWGNCDSRLAEAIARDIFSFDQLGCLSPQFFYVAGDSAKFAEQLSKELEIQRPNPMASARGHAIGAALRTFREEWKFRVATEPGVFVWESLRNLDWVVVHDPDPKLVDNPLHGTILIKPMPADPAWALKPIRHLIGTIGLSTVNLESVDFVVPLGAQRICRIGQMQNPPLTWHHDGWPTLGSLVRYVDIEGFSD